MKTLIPVKTITQVIPVGNGLLLELLMNEEQMYVALLSFLENVSDGTWTKWQKQINAEFYGDAA